MKTDLWVFGYGSLMWRPGFDFVERHPATLRGLHRRLCIYSIRHRGTPEYPGLVLGLDRGGSCRGIAFRVKAEVVAETLAYLKEREQVSFVYREVFRQVRLDDGRTVSAMTYVADRSHPQYAGRLDHDTIVAHVRQGTGNSGVNIDYVRNTMQELENLNITDPALDYVLKRF